MVAALDALVSVASVTLGAAAAIFVVYSLDELVILAAYVAWYLKRGRRARRRPLDAARLRSEPERRIAMLLPAWDESDVIRRMLESNLARLDYNNYRIFVGVYPNDPATRSEVEALAALHPRIACVVTERPGPTTKGDCLNQLYAAVIREQARGDIFDAFVLDDAEDVIPPLELRVINHFLPEMDVIQLPVLPLAVAAGQWTAAHYGDEFAALHARELPVREWISGAVPSAGVGTGFSARALALAAAANDGRPFSLTSLTEDYDVTMRLADHGTRHTFVVEALFRPPEDRTGLPIDDAIAVREYFPKALRAAVRQKGRWIVGNALQGWRQLGWGRGFGRRYFFFRDRKVLVGHLATGLAGFAILCTLAAWAGGTFVLGDTAFPSVVSAGGRVAWLIRVSVVLMAVFLAVRAAFVGAVYGARQAALSIPRAIWGGWINFAASLRALYLFSTQRRPRWDKTAHEFPDQAIKTEPSTRSAPE